MRKATYFDQSVAVKIPKQQGGAFGTSPSFTLEDLQLDEVELDELVEKFFDEITVCAPLEHRNVIDCLGGCWGEAGLGSGVAIVFELASRGNLGHFIGKGWAVTSKLCLGTARAIEYLHSRKISLMHRDLWVYTLASDGERSVSCCGRAFSDKFPILTIDTFCILYARTGNLKTSLSTRQWMQRYQILARASI